MNTTSKKDNELMRILNLKDISRLICLSDMGPLTLKLRKGSDKYIFLLDSVELPKDINKELMQLLFSEETLLKTPIIPKVNSNDKKYIKQDKKLVETKNRKV